MSSVKMRGPVISITLLLIFISAEVNGKLFDMNGADNQHKLNGGGGAPMMFVDELKQTLERYLFGMCPQSYRMPIGNKGRNTTTMACDIDIEQRELAARLASLSLRAHAASRSECSRLGAALSSALGDLARTANNRAAHNNAASNEASKKRKLSKSQKMKIQAKQRTALAVKKKAAAAAAAAAAARITS